MRLPFLAVAALATLSGLASRLDLPSEHANRESVPVLTVLRTPAVAACATAVIVVSATLSMLEPVLSLHLYTNLGVGPARIGFASAWPPWRARFSIRVRQAGRSLGCETPHDGRLICAAGSLHCWARRGATNRRSRCSRCSPRPARS
jgi:hypothetical protein